MKEFLYLCSVFIKLVYRMDAKKILFIAQEPVARSNPAFGYESHH